MGDIYTAAKSCQIWLGTVEDVIDWPDEKVVSTFPRSQWFVAALENIKTVARKEGVLSN